MRSISLLLPKLFSLSLSIYLFSFFSESTVDVLSRGRLRLVPPNDIGCAAAAAAAATMENHRECRTDDIIDGNSALRYGVVKYIRYHVYSLAAPEATSREIVIGR